MRKQKTILGLMLSFFLPLSGFAGGAQEPADSGKTSYTESSLTLFALAEKADEAEMIYIERMTIPAGIGLFSWTAFTVKDGAVSTEGSAAYALRSKTLSSTSTSEGLLILEYRVTADEVLGRKGGKTANESCLNLLLA